MSQVQVLRHTRVGITAAAVVASLCGVAGAQTKKGFMNYLKPTPITCSPLSSASWGVAGVLPRDLCNGIESHKGSAVPPEYFYWDGQIIRATDGKFHMFMSTWAGSAGFNPGWTGSDAFHAISTQGVLGPYERQDYVYNAGGSSPHKGHNVSALELPDGTYAVVVSETVPFTVYQSSSLDGPWKGCQASIQSNGINYGSDGNFSSNVSLIARHDGKFEIVQRHGLIGIADTICGPYKLQKPTWAYPSANKPSIDSIYPKRTSIPGVSNPTFGWEEDPHIWVSGGVYHVLYSGSGDRVGWHVYSRDGINDWTDDGLAFGPRDYQKIFCYEDSTTCLQWYKMERPGVVLQDGHPTHITWAVADVDKDNQIPGGSNHGSKVVVIPFDGVAFDNDYGTGGSSGIGGAGSGGSGSGGVSSNAGGTSSVASGGKSSTGGVAVTGGTSATGTKATGGTAAATGGTAAATGGSRPTGGAASSGGSGSKATGGKGTVADVTGGAAATGGASNATGGALALGGNAPSTGGRASTATAGSLSGVGGAPLASGGSSSSSATNAVGGSSVLTSDATASNDSGCGCRSVGHRSPSAAFSIWAALGALVLHSARRRAARSRGNLR